MSGRIDVPRLVELLRVDNIDRLIKARLTTTERINNLLKYVPQPAITTVQATLSEHEKELKEYDRVMREPPGPTYVKVRGRKHVKSGWK